jgi:NAD(P)-dependent dehydrogenase (short-subunit alcohol dehydrogenase family)
MTGTGQLEGTVALVTGGGHGIGAAIAGTLARLGAAVVVNDVVATAAAAVAEELVGEGKSALGVQADVSDPVEVEQLFQSARYAYGPVDILVNNAGTFCNKSFMDHTAEDWNRVFAVNVRGMFLCAQAAVRDMIERRGGRIVNVASIAAFRTTIPHIAYSASKGAIVTFTRDLAVELAPHDIRVNAVAPGPVDTYGVAGGLEIVDSSSGGAPATRPGTPADIAEAVAFLVSEEAGWIVGETLSVAGGTDLRAGYSMRHPPQ